MDDYFLELKRQQPINYNGLIIYPITFGYICDNKPNFIHMRTY